MIKVSRNRVISILLSITLIIGTMNYALANTSTPKENDPYIGMVSVINEEEPGKEIPSAPSQSTVLPEEQQTQVEQNEHDDAKRKTDRYLVKYKSDSGKNKVEKKLKNKVKNKKEIKGKKEKKLKTVEVLILNESVKPEEFADELRAMNIEDSIEYIQPDFAMIPASISLEVVKDDEDSTRDTTENTQNEDENDISDTKTDNTSADTNTQPSTPSDSNSQPDVTPEDKENPSSTEEQPKDNNETEVKPKDEQSVEEKPTDEQPKDEQAVVGASPVIVAVIDTGADISHNAIKDYLWTNEDDIHGWNFVQDNAEIFNSEKSFDYAHGTQMSGIIAQVARNNQIPLQLINCKVFENGHAYTSDVIEAIEFAQEKGARVINLSFGGGFYNPALFDVIQNTDAMFVCASGNNRINLDKTPVYPACFDLPNIISVSSTNADGGFSYFSNYSTTLVDVTARGRDVTSTIPGNGTGKFSGTSMSAAYVSGVAMAVASMNANMNIEEIKMRILDSSDRLSNLQGKVSNGRSVNLQNALENTIITEVSQVHAADDFDVTNYNPTLNEQLELFSSKKAIGGAVGADHQLILMDDGTVWSFGSNTSGQLGTGENVYARYYYNQPARVIGLSNIIKVVAGNQFSLALAADGTLWGWGKMVSDGGGLGDWEVYATPLQVSNIYNVQDVVAGNDCAIAIANGRQIYMWGTSSYGKLQGCSGTAPQKVSYQFSGPDIISAGRTTTGVVDVYGAYACGDNSSGQLSTGNTTNYGTYKEIPISPADDLVMGGSHAFGRSGVTLFAWGNNSYGQLGIQNNRTNVTMREVIPGFNATKIALGENHSLFIQNKNGVPTLYGCGDNSSKQLATLSGSSTDVITEIPAPESGAVTAIAAGFNNSLAIYNGHAWVWGSNTMRSIANNATSYISTPLQVGGIYQMQDPDSAYDIRWPLYYEGNIKQVDGVRQDVFKTEISEDGYYRIKCSKEDATVLITVALGSSGQIVDHLDANHHEMIYQLTSGVYNFQVDAPTDGQYTLQLEKEGYMNAVTQIDQDIGGVVALDTSGRVWTWGDMYTNTQGDLHSFTKPQRVPILANIVQVVRDNRTNYALSADGAVYLWGQVPQFQMYNEINYYPRPVKLHNLASVSHIAAKGGTLLAVKNDGTLWGIGSNTNQRISNNTTKYYIGELTQIAGIADITKISIGFYACAALKSDGTVWTWGYNSDVLGRPVNNNVATPTQITTLSGITDVQAGENHMLALKNDNTVWAWGSRSQGQLGDGSTSGSSATPANTGLMNITQISVGENHNAARQSNGKAYVWGASSKGQCQTTTSVTRPKLIDYYITCIFAGNDTTFRLKNTENLLGLGDNTGKVLSDGSETMCSSAVAIKGQRQNDSVDYIKSISLFGENNNTVDITLPNNTPSFYQLVMDSSCRLMFQGENLAIEIRESASQSLVYSGTCNGTSIVDGSFIPMNYDIKITTPNQKIFSITEVDAVDNGVSVAVTSVGQYYNITVLGELMDSLSGIYSVTYDPEFFDVVSVCALSYDAANDIGAFPEFGIQVTKNRSGIVEFSRNMTIPAGKKWSGAINIIRVRAKQTGTTSLTLVKS